mgnify:CR=1 FL=1
MKKRRAANPIQRLRFVLLCYIECLALRRPIFRLGYAYLSRVSDVSQMKHLSRTLL